MCKRCHEKDGEVLGYCNECVNLIVLEFNYKMEDYDSMGLGVQLYPTESFCMVA